MLHLLGGSPFWHSPPTQVSHGDITTMLAYAQKTDTHIRCRDHLRPLPGLLNIILIVMHDITSTLPVDVLPSARWYAKWPPHVNHRRALGGIWLGFTGYGIGNDDKCRSSHLI